MNTFMEKSKQSVKSIQELEIFIKNYSDKQDSRRLTEFPQIRGTKKSLGDILILSECGRCCHRFC